MGAGLAPLHGRDSPFGGREQNFAVTVELVNSEGKTIGSERITMRGGYDVEWAEGTLRRFTPRLQGVQNLGFSRVNAYDITDSLAVRIASIDGVDAETAAKSKVVNILREAEYARLPEVVARLDTRAVARFMQDTEIDPSGVITGYKGSGGRLVIPANVFGLPVTAIGSGVFTKVEARYSQVSGTYNVYVGKGIYGVTIPSSVTRIGTWAFAGNSLGWIGAIIIPNSVTSIGREGIFLQSINQHNHTGKCYLA